MTPLDNKINFIDTHAHLFHPPFENDRADVLLRLKAAGVSRVINIILGPDKKLIEDTFSWAQNLSEVYFGLGIHPHDASMFNEHSIDELTPYFSHPKMKVVGEIGLDYYYNHSQKSQQIACFENFLDFSKKINLPVSIHTRDAFEDTYAILKNSNVLGTCGGVIHCFTGNWDQAKKWLDLGAYLSYSGILTFKKATELHEAAKNTPMNRLLIETDAPFLAPEPYRGKRNEPAFISKTAQYMAHLKEMPIEHIAETTTLNAKKLFKIP